MPGADSAVIFKDIWELQLWNSTLYASSSESHCTDRSLQKPILAASYIGNSYPLLENNPLLHQCNLYWVQSVVLLKGRGRISLPTPNLPWPLYTLTGSILQLDRCRAQPPTHVPMPYSVPSGRPQRYITGHFVVSVSLYQPRPSLPLYKFTWLIV